MEEKLPLHEWVAVIVIVSILLFLTALATFNRSESAQTTQGPPHYILSQEIEVTVEGAVEHPGAHLVKRGSRIKDVLKLAKPLPNANLKKIKLESKVRDGKHLVIPEVAMITIQLEGAVKQQGSFKVAKGTKLQDLLSLIEFNEDADLSIFNKKRKLKDGEVVTVNQQR